MFDAKTIVLVNYIDLGQLHFEIKALYWHCFTFRAMVCLAFTGEVNGKSDTFIAISDVYAGSQSF